MKVLLVRLSSMGDLIHTLPAIDDLSRMRPDVELHWLSEAGFADIARLPPFVRQVHTMRWRQWRKQLSAPDTWREMNRLRIGLQRNKFDVVLDSQGLLKSAAFSKIANVPIKGLNFQSAREPWAALLYNQTFQVDKRGNAVWRNRMLFAQTFGYSLPQTMSFGVVVPESAHINGLPERFHVALHATSRDSKLWPLNHWLELLTRLNGQDGAAVMLPWGNDVEKKRAEAIAANLPFAIVCERLDLLQAAYLLDRADSVIGVDTGLLHLANALDKPLVGIYTDTDPVKTGVQTSAWAQNIGGVGQMPTVDAVYDLLQQSLLAQPVVGEHKLVT